MNLNFAKLFFCLLLMAWTKNICANNPTADSANVLIAYNSTDQNLLNAVKKAIHAQGTGRYIKYCTNHSVFMVKVAGDQQAADAFLAGVRKMANASPQVLYIRAYQFGDIDAYCTSDNAPYGSYRH